MAPKRQAQLAQQEYPEAMQSQPSLRSLHLLQDKHQKLTAEHDTIDDMPLAARLTRISSLTQRGSCASSPPTAEPHATPKAEVKQPKGELPQLKGELKQVSASWDDSSLQQLASHTLPLEQQCCRRSNPIGEAAQSKSKLKR